MHPDCVESELEKSKQRLIQLEGFQQIKNDNLYGKLLIQYFEKFNPCKTSHSGDYNVYVGFRCSLNFQATDQAFQKFAEKTGMIPTAWWYDEKEGITTIAFDKIFYPKNTAFVGDIYDA